MEAVAMKTVTRIEANPLLVKNNNEMKRLKVAAYCRVSTDDEEQLNSYEAQIKYYTETISKNPSWIFGGIYADEGITGTMVKKRKNFLRLMRDCEKGKVDYILTKSISRFARNTVDSLSWVRKLRAMGIGVYFEEQAIDSLKAENEMLIGLFSVIAQSESENISSNVKWGIRQSMKNGKFASNFDCYGYRRGEDGIPKIVPEQAEIVKLIYERYLDGESLDQIQSFLKRENIKTYRGNDVWGKEVIKSVLTNEKYVGDVMLQKTYCADCISKKVKKNRGELAKYLVSNNHPAIIERETYNLVQLEMARRGSKSKKSVRTLTEQGKYSGKYALSELMICGECGSHYRRTSKSKNGKRQYVWRCINRIENGAKVCDAAGADESRLHAAICRCLNKMFLDRDETFDLLRSNLSYAIAGDQNSLNAYSIENEIKQLTSQADDNITMAYKTTGDKERFLSIAKSIYEKIAILRNQLEVSKRQMEESNNTTAEVDRVMSMFQNESMNFNEYDDIIIRRLVECIRVSKSRTITVILKGGMQAEESY